MLYDGVPYSGFIFPSFFALYETKLTIDSLSDSLIFSLNTALALLPISRVLTANTIRNRLHCRQFTTVTFYDVMHKLQMVTGVILLTVEKSLGGANRMQKIADGIGITFTISITLSLSRPRPIVLLAVRMLQ